MSATKDYLEQMVSIRKTMYRHDYPYSCFEEFVLKNGVEFYNVSDRKKIKLGKAKECFKNAFDLANTRVGLHYVEGFASTKALGLPFLHAWCVNKEGVVYDPTWPDGENYFGVIFSMEYVMKTIVRRKSYGVIDNMECGFPLLTGKDTYVYPFKRGTVESYFDDESLISSITTKSYLFTIIVSIVSDSSF